MLTNDNIDKILKDNYESICESLNIHGTNVAETSWNDYQSLKNDHNLEVSKCTQYIQNRQWYVRPSHSLVLKAETKDIHCSP